MFSVVSASRSHKIILDILLIIFYKGKGSFVVITVHAVYYDRCDFVILERCYTVLYFVDALLLPVNYVVLMGFNVNVY